MARRQIIDVPVEWITRRRDRDLRSRLAEHDSNLVLAGKLAEAGQAEPTQPRCTLTPEAQAVVDTEPPRRARSMASEVRAEFRAARFRYR